MTTEDVLNYIDTADEEELQNLSNAIKARGPRPRILIQRIIRDDVKALAEALPKRSTEYNGKQFAQTTAYYVKVLRDLTAAVLKLYTVRKSERGYPMWYPHDSVRDCEEDDYVYVFHELTTKLLDLMDEFDTTY